MVMIYIEFLNYDRGSNFSLSNNLYKRSIQKGTVGGELTANSIWYDKK